MMKADIHNINRKTVLAGGIVLFLLIAGLVAVIISRPQHKGGSQPAGSNQGAMSQAVEEPPAPDIPEDDPAIRAKYKSACDILDGALAKSTLGGEGQREAQPTISESTGERITNCEYSRNEMKVVLNLHEYPTEDNAANGFEGYKASSSSSNVVERKDRYVAVVSVTSHDTFDQEVSTKLMTEILGKLQ